MKKYDNFCPALENLKDIYNYEEPYDNVVLTGLVALFEICFEEGQTGSPKKILKTAYQAGMIVDEELWIAALVSRNNVAHAYNKEVALDIVQKTKKDYYEMFCGLKEEMDQILWNEK